MRTLTVGGFERVPAARQRPGSTGGVRCWGALGRIAAVLVVVEASVVVAAARSSLQRTVYAMGTQLELEVEGLPPGELTAATEAAVREVERIEAACSTWRADSDWSRLNASGGAEVVLAREWLSLLGTVVEWSHRTQGAFDPVLGALIRAWGTRRGGRVPSAQELALAREASGVGLLVIDLSGGTARLRHPAAALEEGAFLKGYALDRMAEVLRRAGVTTGVLDFGGQVLAFGRHRRSGISAPDARHRVKAEVDIEDASLSTSGTSERGRHILDPMTGERSEAWGSVSVVASDGLTADILSTALYVMGPERGLRWANAHRVAALFQRTGEPPLRSESLSVTLIRSRP